MDTRTEEEAKRLICPLLTTPGTLMKCQGCECMAWAWDNDGFEYYFRFPTNKDADGIGRFSPEDEGVKNYIRHGWEAFVFERPLNVGGSQRLEVLRRPLPHGRTGSCGALTAKVADVEVSS